MIKAHRGARRLITQKPRGAAKALINLHESKVWFTYSVLEQVLYQEFIYIDL